MKKTIYALTATGLLLASCDTGVKDSYQTMPYPEYNLIVDTQDGSAPATASYSTYEVKFNISKQCVDVKTSDLILNNKKYSFETDTMSLRQKFFKIDGKDAYYLTFSKYGNAGVGSNVSDITGTFVGCYVRQTTDSLNAAATVGATERLDLSYTLDGNYRVQTFWPTAYYKGQTAATSDHGTYSTKETGYYTEINFSKKTAKVYVYNAEISPEKEDALPKVIRFEGIPVIITHNGFSLEADAPKTKVLGIKDGRSVLVDSLGFEAKDFSLVLTSPDLTDAMISYKLNDRQFNFRGCSIVKDN